MAGIESTQLADTSDFGVCQEVAFLAVRRDSGLLPAVLAVVEQLLDDEANYEFGVGFLEDVQNLVSHRVPDYVSPEDVVGLLGPRSAVVWASVAEFWASVAEWRGRNGEPLTSSTEMLTAVENERLRKLMWTGNRTLSGGEKLGLADAVRYEKAGGVPMAGYSHFQAALRSVGQG